MRECFFHVKSWSVKMSEKVDEKYKDKFKRALDEKRIGGALRTEEILTSISITESD